MQEKEKYEYRRANYKIRRQVFCPTNHSRQESKGFFYRRATNKGRKYKKPRKPLSPPGLVCRRKEKEKDQGRWSVATRKGREKKKKKKKKTKEGEKVAPPKARFRVPSTKKFLFLVHEYLGSERPISIEVSAPASFFARKPCAKEVPEMDYFTQRKQYLKRTTLRTY